jgi:hypothetical protein
MSEIPLNIGDLLVIMSIFASTGGAVWRIGRVIAKFESRLVDLERDKYPMSVASEAALRMAIENPSLKVPDPRDPNRVIQVVPAERPQP